MRKNKNIIRGMLASCVLAMTLVSAGCGNSGNDNTDVELAPFDETQIAEIEDFSDKEEKEIKLPETEATPTPTNTPTPIPPTPTPAPTIEPEIVEEKYAKDYDFSDFRVLQAILKDKGGLGIAGYTSVVEQDDNTRTRVQTVTTNDGEISAVFTADPVSGNTNRIVSIYFRTENPMDDMRNALLRFDNGISENNIDKFMAGNYNGFENAPYLGLLDSSLVITDNEVSVTLVKNPVEEGNTPYWSGNGSATDLGILIADSKVRGGIAEQDPFITVFGDLVFGEVTRTLFNVSGYRVVTDETGNVLESSSGIRAEYEASTGEKCIVTAPVENNSGVLVEFTNMIPMSGNDIQMMSDRVWQKFKDGQYNSGNEAAAESEEAGDSGEGENPEDSSSDEAAEEKVTSFSVLLK